MPKIVERDIAPMPRMLNDDASSGGLLRAPGDAKQNRRSSLLTTRSADAASAALPAGAMVIGKPFDISSLLAEIERAAEK